MGAKSRISKQWIKYINSLEIGRGSHEQRPTGRAASCRRWIAFVFDNLRTVSTGAQSDSSGLDLAAKMSDAWIAFARTGDPNTQALPEWPADTTNTRETMIFNTTCRIETYPGSAERHLWLTI